MDFDHELDARGLHCPLPILRCKKALAGVAPGKVLLVFATDPGSVKDFIAFCKQTGHEMLSHQQVGAELRFYIKKRSN